MSGSPGSVVERRPQRPQAMPSSLLSPLNSGVQLVRQHRSTSHANPVLKYDQEFVLRRRRNPWGGDGIHGRERQVHLVRKG